MEAKKLTGIELIAEERQRQIDVEGWTKEHDVTHAIGELSMAAACYAINKLSVKARVQIYLPAERSFFSGNVGDRGDRQLQKAGWYNAWPWNDGDKREQHNRMKSLINAGALIAAEIDRLQNTKQ